MLYSSCTQSCYMFHVCHSFNSKSTCCMAIWAKPSRFLWENASHLENIIPYYEKGIKYTMSIHTVQLHRRTVQRCLWNCTRQSLETTSHAAAYTLLTVNKVQLQEWSSYTSSSEGEVAEHWRWRYLRDILARGWHTSCKEYVVGYVLCATRHLVKGLLLQQMQASLSPEQQDAAAALTYQLQLPDIHQ